LVLARGEGGSSDQAHTAATKAAILPIAFEEPGAGA
jgi:hypothetical protein